LSLIEISKNCKNLKSIDISFSADNFILFDNTSILYSSNSIDNNSNIETNKLNDKNQNNQIKNVKTK
jgi:hypothetical protein